MPQSMGLLFALSCLPLSATVRRPAVGPPRPPALRHSEMPRHTADGIISVQVLEGLIQFNTDKQSVELGKGQMLALHERIPHSVKAIRETVFLLTLTSTLEAN